MKSQRIQSNVRRGKIIYILMSQFTEKNIHILFDDIKMIFDELREKRYSIGLKFNLNQKGETMRNICLLIIKQFQNIFDLIYYINFKQKNHIDLLILRPKSIDDPLIFNLNSYLYSPVIFKEKDQFTEFLNKTFLNDHQIKNDKSLYPLDLSKIEEKNQAHLISLISFIHKNQIQNFSFSIRIHFNQQENVYCVILSKSDFETKFLYCLKKTQLQLQQFNNQFQSKLQNITDSLSSLEHRVLKLTQQN